MKKFLLILAALALMLAGFTTASADAIPFDGDELYGVAFLGYQDISALDTYVDMYLDGEFPPIHYISDGEYYLIVPRYPHMALSLYQIDPDTSEQILIYEDPDCRPFVIQCNVSDILPDAYVILTDGPDSAEFCPSLSLENGDVQIGERGLLLGF